MKLSGQKEWIVIGALIIYIAFFPPFEPIRQALKTPIGKAAMLAAIVYTWKYWSPLVALLFAINYLRCAGGGNIWEMFSGAEAECTCLDSKSVFDKASKKCKNDKGEETKLGSCTCASGYAWDVTKKECVVSSGTQPPVPPPPASEAPKPLEPPAQAPAVSDGASTGSSTTPQTTPGAAQDVVNSTPAKTESFGSGPIPSEPFGTQYSGF